MTAYYNEFDKKTAAWLRELIKQGLIADGVVDDRSIEDVQANDLRGFTQCHFFAGIGVWSYALRQAGWSDDRPVWTGSCPCQPFSVAGKGKGTSDDRHLWPVLRELVAQCNPSVFLGEQVAAKAGRAWINTVRLEMETLGYGVGIADLCAAGGGAPHIRQRLWFVAEGLSNSKSIGCNGWPQKFKQQRPEGRCEREDLRGKSGGLDTVDRMANNADCGCDQGRQCESEAGSNGTIGNGSFIERQPATGPTNGHWSNPDWLFCRDGKWRPVEPGTSPLANGATNRVVKLRGYGNAIVSEVAKEFIAAYMETL